MSRRFNTETFYRPAELSRERSTLPAVLFNRCRLLLSRYGEGYLFVPIRSMQYLSVIEQEEIIFVDSQGGYVVQDGEGGRLIALAWQFPRHLPRASLSRPVAIDLVHYRDGGREIHRRIMSEFSAALDRLNERLVQNTAGSTTGRILPFRSS